jgi:hypothetical protein
MVWLLVRVTLGLYLTGSVLVLGWSASTLLRRAMTALALTVTERLAARRTPQARRRCSTPIICIDSHWRFGTSTVAVHARELLESQEQTRRAW